MKEKDGWQENLWVVYITATEVVGQCLTIIAIWAHTNDFYSVLVYKISIVNHGCSCQSFSNSRHH